MVVLLLFIAIGISGTGRSSSDAGGSPAAAPLAPHREITAREWELIAKDPDAHEGERIIVYGRVTQFDAATGTEQFRASIDGVDHPEENGYFEFDTNTVLNGDAALLAEVVTDDLIKAEVTVEGSISYETAIGGSLTVPVLQVDSIQVTGSAA